MSKRCDDCDPSSSCWATGNQCLKQPVPQDRTIRTPQSAIRNSGLCNVVIRRHPVHDDSWPTFAEMTRRSVPTAN